LNFDLKNPDAVLFLTVGFNKFALTNYNSSKQLF